MKTSLSNIASTSNNTRKHKIAEVFGHDVDAQNNDETQDANSIKKTDKTEMKN